MFICFIFFQQTKNKWYSYKKSLTLINYFSKNNSVNDKDYSTVNFIAILPNIFLIISISSEFKSYLETIIINESTIYLTSISSNLGYLINIKSFNLSKIAYSLKFKV